MTKVSDLLSNLFSNNTNAAYLKDSTLDQPLLELSHPERIFSYQNLSLSVQSYEEFTVEDKISVVKKALIQELFYPAEYILDTLHKEYGKNTQYSEAIYDLQQELKVKKTHKKSLKITIFGDSLALPRRGYVKHGHPLYNPILLNTVEDEL